MSEYDETGMYADERKARPLEVVFKYQTRDRDAFSLIKRLLLHTSLTVRGELDPQGYLVGRCRDRIEVIDQSLASKAEELAEERRKFVQAARDADEWASPHATGGGWLCPESPTGVCTYDNPEAQDDFCDHCEFPEERK